MSKYFIFLTNFLCSVICFTAAYGQDVISYDSSKIVPANWWQLDHQQHQVPGISIQQAYSLLKGRIPSKVLVAVIDSGIDIDHEDLRDVIWTNSKEVAGNGIDDDGNGYIDDIHGWNFIGSREGENIKYDTYELTREYKRLMVKYKSMTESQKMKDPEWAYFEKIEREYQDTVKKMQTQYAGFKGFYDQYKKAERLLEAYLDLEQLTMEDLETWDSPDDKISQARNIVMTAFDNGLDPDQMEKGMEYFSTALDYGYNLEFDPRAVIGDDPDNPYEKYYGNNDVVGEFSFHGTHVAGIIAAKRDNKLGVDGVADHAEIMVLRAVPNGDERDKDIANAIFYAVDNGAQIINMSFGKRFSPHKKVVDKAIEYAESKGVLIIHAAGNSAHDTQKVDNFPTPKYNSGSKASNWLEVGAVSWKGSEELIASFSNYGKNSVDVFAPGVDILSTAPDQEYEEASGTSMAAPVTTGVAALLMSYFPGLSAQEVKKILMESSISYDDQKVKVSGHDEFVKFGQLSKTGGVINAYEAVKMALNTQPRGKKKLPKD